MSRMSPVPPAKNSVLHTNEGVKFDQGKTRYDLIPWEHEEGLAQVFTMGATKYGDNNWQLGLDPGRLLAATRRHIEAYRRGEIADPESGLNHMYHAAWSLLAIAWFDRQKPLVTACKDCIEARYHEECTGGL